jgi:hypothetical protein
MRRGIEVSPRGTNGERRANLRRAACSDSVVMRLVLAVALGTFGDVERNAASGPTNLIGESAVNPAERVDDGSRRRRGR